MTRVVEAIFEDGVLKPLEPLPLTNQQHVTLTVHDSVEGPEPPNARRAEMRWIGENAPLYRGEYVALQGSELLSHGTDGHAVIDEARRKGVEHPLIYHVPEYLGEPSIEWI